MKHTFLEDTWDELSSGKIIILCAASRSKQSILKIQSQSEKDWYPGIQDTEEDAESEGLSLLFTHSYL